MSRCDVAVIDYGVGNLLSVRRGLEHRKARVVVTDDPSAILAAPRVILPGVGAFAQGMGELQRTGLDLVVKQVAARGVPVLGICLGMQMLLEASEEFGVTPGLGLIAGRVSPIPVVDRDGRPQKVPHIGWSPLVRSDGAEGWHRGLLAGIPAGEAMYFVHSFMVMPHDSSHRVADSTYGGLPITAVVARGNIWGCQFHPEKSGAAGLRLLGNFLSL